MSRVVFALYGASIVAHLGFAFGLSSLRKPEKREVTAITIAESPKPKKPDIKPPPPTPAVEQKAPERQVSKQKAKAAPAKNSCVTGSTVPTCLSMGRKCRSR